MSGVVNRWISLHQLNEILHGYTHTAQPGAGHSLAQCRTELLRRTVSRGLGNGDRLGRTVRSLPSSLRLGCACAVCIILSRLPQCADNVQR